MCQHWNKCTPEEYEKTKIEHYAKCGWKCLVLWQEELKNEQTLVEKTVKFYTFENISLTVAF